MEIHLKVLVGRHAGQVIRISAPKFLIGRAEDCQLRPHSEMVSRHHCALIIEGDYAEVRDFGSKNGTFVNDERVLPVRELKSGDVLRIGPLKFEVTLVSRPAVPRKPKVSSVREAAIRSAEGGAESVDEEHVHQWLEEGDAKGLGEHPTRTMIGGDETANFDADTLLSSASQKEEEDDAEPVTLVEEEPSSQAPESPKPIKPPVQADSSNEAAAEILRKLRRFR